jgi:RsiW-degrading membrane proteinase PrsW (M82 family)
VDKRKEGVIMKPILNDTNADLAGGAVMMGVIVSTLIAIVIGVLIWYQINGAIYTQAVLAPRTIASTTAYNVSRAAQTALWNSTNASANTIWALFPIICIVLIAGVVLAIVMGFGRQQY